MCDKQERIDELELELSEIHKNYKEALKFDAETFKLIEEAKHLNRKTGSIIPTVVISVLAIVFTLIGRVSVGS